MHLTTLIEALPPENAPSRIVSRNPESDPAIQSLHYDSRKVMPGTAFFALRGADTDGHRYLEQALERGASALFVEELPPEIDLQDASAIVVSDARRALAPVATHFFDSPSEELTLIGVTGTNGKTTTTYLVESILTAAGRVTGLIGTIEIRCGKLQRASQNTTPESLDLQRALREMRTQGADSVVMEVSSHGLSLGRVDGCRFSVAAFTNLTQDHLDFHEDMDSYRASKTGLMRRHMDPKGTAVLNLDDPAADAFREAASEAGVRVVGVTRRRDLDAEVRLLDAKIDLEGTRARVQLPSGEIAIELPLVGDFNVENMLIACGISVALQVPPSAISEGIARCIQVPGRAERVGAELDGAPTVIVDYAHTPDAVDKLLATLAPLCDGRLVVVFGCGGDRDRAKRPLMAEAVARHADAALATSDNPRTEDAERILDDIEPGLRDLTRVEPEALGESTRAWCRVTDRREAIDRAIGLARPEDTVVIAGKGHEDYQIIGRTKLAFSDPQEALRALRSRRASAAEDRGVQQ